MTKQNYQNLINAFIDGNIQVLLGTSHKNEVYIVNYSNQKEITWDNIDPKWDFNDLNNKYTPFNDYFLIRSINALK